MGLNANDGPCRDPPASRRRLPGGRTLQAFGRIYRPPSPPAASRSKGVTELFDRSTNWPSGASSPPRRRSGPNQLAAVGLLAQVDMWSAVTKSARSRRSTGHLPGRCQPPGGLYRSASAWSWGLQRRRARRPGCRSAGSDGPRPAATRRRPAGRCRSGRQRTDVADSPTAPMRGQAVCRSTCWPWPSRWSPLAGH